MVFSQVTHVSLLGSRRSVEDVLLKARSAQTRWGKVSVKERLEVVARFRHLLAERAEDLAATVELAGRSSIAETLSAEILPLAAGCRFLEKRAARLLRSRTPKSGRLRLPGEPKIEVERQPWGSVLLIGAGNYPIFLPGVQMIQALVAGNSVLVKPAPGAERSVERLAELMLESGLEADLLVVLDSAPEVAQQVMEAGVDRVLFTGSSATGRQIQRQLAERLTPATLELSGCDAVFVHPEADLEMVTEALQFGLTINSGATCISPRRVFVTRDRAAELERRLRDRLTGLEAAELDEESARKLQRMVLRALRDGARLVTGTMQFDQIARPVVLADVDPEMEVMQCDLFAPLLSIVSVDSMDTALDLDDYCKYALGATVFGPTKAAHDLAKRVKAGVVVINDMIAPTADPEVPFGGSGESGFGVTRGAEGLLDLTRPRVLVTRAGRWRPHFTPLAHGDETMFLGALKGRHSASLTERLAGWKVALGAVRRKARQMEHEGGVK